MHIGSALLQHQGESLSPCGYVGGYCATAETQSEDGGVDVHCATCMYSIVQFPIATFIRFEFDGCVRVARSQKSKDRVDKSRGRMYLGRLCLGLASVMYISRVYWPRFGTNVMHDWTQSGQLIVSVFHLINQVTSAHQSGFTAQLTFKTDNLCYLL
jgi:hypothetical protein